MLDIKKERRYVNNTVIYITIFMKITDLSLVYVAVILPIIIIVYVNVSFTIKAKEQEIYYKKLIEVAASDASNQMKQVENNDPTVDYGYSGELNNKISVNAQVAVDTFLKNLYNNFGIKDNISAQRYLQLYVPAIAVIDYNGVQISSIETYTKDGEEVTEHVVKPKVYYTYDYTIVRDPTVGGFKYVDGYVDEMAVSHHHIEFTMDDFVTHRGTYLQQGKWLSYDTKSFYIADETLEEFSSRPKNIDLYENINFGTTSGLKDSVIENLREKRKEVIVNTVVREITYAINKNNIYARNAGITYNFSFPTTTQDDMYASIENIGFLAFVQGINVGNKYLNAKAYSVTNLELTTKFYFSVPSEKSKYKQNLYHKDTDCPEYIAATEGNNDGTGAVDKVLPKYTTTKQQASSQIVKFTFKDQGRKMTSDNKAEFVTVWQTQGFYPCPVCNP